jgi:tetratricopeptide (TPR) repeat protein
MTGPVSDSALIAARTAAASGAWADVRSVLERDAGRAERDGAQSMLLGEACLRTGQPQIASRWLRIAAPLLARAGDRPAQRRVANMEGAAAFALGALEDAADRFGVALEMARADGDALLTARTTNNLGAIAALRGDADRAIAAYQLAIPAYQRLGNTQGLAESWHNLGISLRTRGELNAADDAERRAIEFANEARNARLAAMAQVGRAEISLRRGDAAWAKATADRAAVTFSAVPDYLLQADALRVLADACDRMELVEEADRAIASALQIAREHSHRTQEAQALQTQAQIFLRRGDRTQALTIGSQAREQFGLLGSASLVAELTDWLAAITVQ